MGRGITWNACAETASAAGLTPFGFSSGKEAASGPNNTTALSATTGEADPQSRTRNYCNACEHESFALVPISARAENVGLIQLNDMRKGLFRLDLIEYMQMIGGQIGPDVLNSMLYEKMKESSLKAAVRD